MFVDMSTLPLPVRFQGTSRLLHPKTIHIAPQRVLVNFYAYITNIYRLCKKITSTKENTVSLHFLDLKEVWVDQWFLALPPSILGFCSFCGMCTSPNTVGADFRTVWRLPHPPANTLYIHVFKKTIRDMSEHYG
jgi:hypothetical protein